MLTEMDKEHEHQPGDPAPVTGYYEELNASGTPTGWVRFVQKGEPLPASQGGLTWRSTEVE
jgi:hypothetical protein